MGRRRDHYPRFNTRPCPNPEACARLYHGIGGPDAGDTCECCGADVAAEAEADAPSPRYVSRENRWSSTVTVFSIYDTKTKAWPAFQGGMSVPQRFDTLTDAQAWADEHLNGTSR